jgi:hypothetical protein
VRGAAGVAGEDVTVLVSRCSMATTQNEVPPSLSNLAGLLCMVAADGYPLFVFANGKDLVTDSIKKSRKIL